jgi:hypothetical protein
LLIGLWLLLGGLFLAWGIFSIGFVVQIPGGPEPIPDWGEDSAFSTLYPLLYFGTLLSTISWFVFASVFAFFAYGAFKGKKPVWSAGIILSTIFIVILGLMLASLMATILIFLNYFSVLGLITVVNAFLINLAIVFCLTRPDTKIYFNEKNSRIHSLY